MQELTAALDSARTQGEMNLASKRISDFWDAKLASTENLVEQKLNNKEQKRFFEAEKHWHSYRIQEVRFRVELFTGGSVQPLIANESYSQITKDRVTELESVLADILGGRR